MGSAYASLEYTVELSVKGIRLGGFLEQKIRERLS